MTSLDTKLQVHGQHLAPAGNVNHIFMGKMGQNGKIILGQLSMRQKLFKTAKTLQAISRHFNFFFFRSKQTARHEHMHLTITNIIIFLWFVVIEETPPDCSCYKHVGIRPAVGRGFSFGVRDKNVIS